MDNGQVLGDQESPYSSWCLVWAFGSLVCNTGPAWKQWLSDDWWTCIASRIAESTLARYADAAESIRISHFNIFESLHAVIHRGLGTCAWADWPLAAGMQIVCIPGSSIPDYVDACRPSALTWAAASRTTQMQADHLVSRPSFCQSSLEIGTLDFHWSVTHYSTWAV